MTIFIKDQTVRRVKALEKSKHGRRVILQLNLQPLNQTFDTSFGERSKQWKDKQKGEDIANLNSWNNAV
jgi:hypothetical protein